MAIDQDRLESLFFAVRDLAAADRDVFLEEACAGDVDLREALVAMLASEDVEDSLLDRPIHVGETAASAAPDREGDQIGRYKLLQKLGEGGFGEVYMAEQFEPVSRKVALKIIKPGMDSRAVIARFEAERQALAMMDHPNIARVLDGGATDEGRPFFVMELVKGVSITEYCDKRRLPATARLALFVDVCHAVQHAHQKGIIHRDLKPSNVMITLHDGKPVVKVIDFGVARAIHQKLTDKTLFTRYGQMIGTPQYMSPEQAEMSGLDVDTRSDIYSLGVLLYELLTGEPPLTADLFQEAGFAEIKRVICEHEVAKPSTRMSTTAEQQLFDLADSRGVSPEELRKQFQGDLDWVVMKTLEKERDRRYATAHDLAADITRYLNDETVVARPPSWGYRLQKYVRRHRAAVLTASLVASVLVVATMVSSGLAIWLAEALKTSDERLAQVSVERDKTKTALAEQQRLAAIAAQQAAELNSQLYQANLAGARVAYGKWNVVEARALLSRCPRDLRGWEWNRLKSEVEAARFGVVAGTQKALFSQDSARFITIGARDAPQVCIWDRNTLSCVQRLDVGTEPLRMNALHPNGRVVAVSSKRGQITLLDTVTGDVLWTKPAAHAERIDGLNFDASGKRLASVGWGGYLRVWDAQSGELLVERGDLGYLRDVAFSPGGDYIATAGDTNASVPMRLFKADDLHLVREFDHNGKGIYSVSFSPDGKRLACGGKGGRVSVQDVSTGSMEVVLDRHDSKVESVAFSPDGELVASGSRGVVLIRNATTGELVHQVLTDHTVTYWLAFSPDQQTLTTYGGRFGQEQGTLVHDLTQLPSPDVVLDEDEAWNWCAVAFSPDGRQLVTGGLRRALSFWDPISGDLIEVVDFPEETQCVLWGRDGKVLYVRAFTGLIRAYDVVRREVRWTRHAALADKPTACGLDLSPDGEQLYVVADQGDILVLDRRDGELLARFAAHEADVYDVACAPNGKLLATAGGNHEVLLWDAATRERQHVLAGHTGTIREVLFSPDSRTLVSTSIDGTTRLWDCDTGKELHQLSGHSYGVWGCVFSSDGRRVFSADGLGHLIGWDVGSGREVFRLEKRRCCFLDISPSDTIACVGMGIQVIGTTLPDAATARHRNVLVDARRLIARVQGEASSVATQLERMASDTTASQQARDVAQAMVRVRGEDPFALATASFQILRERRSAEYPVALEQALRAAQSVPQAGEYATLLGLAHYRAGQLQEAQATMQRALGLESLVRTNNAVTTDFRSAIHAVQAMATHRLGQPNAAASLDAAEAFLPASPADDSPIDFHALVQEAKELLASNNSEAAVE